MNLRLELFVKDIGKSVEFYRSVLDFTILKDINENYIPIRKGDVVLGLGKMENLPADHPLKASNNAQQKGQGVEIVLEVEDIYDVYSKVIHREYPIQSDLAKRPWGVVDFRIMDPDGYYLRLTSIN